MHSQTTAMDQDCPNSVDIIDGQQQHVAPDGTLASFIAASTSSSVLLCTQSPITCIGTDLSTTKAWAYVLLDRVFSFLIPQNLQQPQAGYVACHLQCCIVRQPEVLCMDMANDAHGKPHRPGKV